MKITLENLYLIEGDSKTKAIASVLVDDCFKVTGIRVKEGENGVFLSMPNRKAKDGTNRDIVYPINSETRQLFNDAILPEYEKQTK